MKLKTLCRNITIESKDSGVPAPESALWVEPRHYSVKLTNTKTGRTVDVSPYSEGSTEKGKGRPTSYRVLASLLSSAAVSTDYPTFEAFFKEFGDERGKKDAKLVYASYKLIRVRLGLLLGDDYETFITAAHDDDPEI